MGRIGLHLIPSMNKFLLLACALCVSTATAHLSTFCSATNPKKAGVIEFYFGTYHTFQSKTPPGTVTISQPGVAGGASLKGSFSNKYNAMTNNQYFMISTTKAAKDNLVAKAGLSKDSVVDCYVQNKKSAAMKAPSTGQWVVPSTMTSADPDMKCQNSGNWLKVGFWSKLTINNAKSGDWELEVTGTDQVYDPGQNQCSLSKKNPKWIGGMVVADGTPSCKGTPPVSSGIDPASVANCKDLIGGAVCNSWKCKSDKAESSGSIKCENGAYKVTAYCKPETACAKQADDEAKDDAKKADDEAKKADEEVGNTHVKIVKFQPIPLDTIKENDCPGLWSTLKAKSNYNDHRKAHEGAKQKKIAADAKKKAADEEVKKMEEAKKNAVLKCQCATQDKHDKAYAACTANKNAQKTGWVKSHHLACVEAGSVTLNSNHHSSGQCKHEPVPEVKEKQMAFQLAEKACMNMKTELEMDDMVMAEELEEVEVTALPPKGYHEMPNGEIMADIDM